MGAISLALKNQIATFIFIGFIIYIVIGLIGEMKAIRGKALRSKLSQNTADDENDEDN